MKLFKNLGKVGLVAVLIGLGFFAAKYKSKKFQEYKPPAMTQTYHADNQDYFSPLTLKKEFDEYVPKDEFLSGKFSPRTLPNELDREKLDKAVENAYERVKEPSP